jgi:signal transduction histidine kinase/FixJ family two-component response regulator
MVDQILNPAGFEVLIAQDGEQGLEQTLHQDLDLVIMDVNLPDTSGLELLEKIRDANIETPVILMTFHGSQQAAVQAFRLGAQDYVIKPYTVEQMQHCIDRALTTQRLRRERDRLTEAVSQAQRHRERQLKELTTLSGIGKSVIAMLDEDRLLTRIVEAAVYITGAEEGFLLLVDDETGELYMRAARGHGEKYARGFRLKVDDSLAGEVLRTGRPVMITGSPQSDPYKLKTGYLVKSLLHVPLKVGDRAIGVLSVDHMFEDRAFGNHELYLLSSLADYAAIALENARLRAAPAKPEQAPQVAVPTDSTTDPAADLLSDVTELQSRLDAGSELVDTLREQVISLQIWLDAVAAKGKRLGQLDAPKRARPLSAQPTQAEIAGLSQQVNTILNSMIEGVLVIDPQDQVILINDMATDLLEHPLQIGMAVQDVCDDPRWIKTYQIVKRASQIKEGNPGSEIRSASTRLSVGQRILRASFRARSRETETSNGIVVVLYDVTAEQEAQRAKESFVASISQELRTPITSILGYADLLMNETVGPLEKVQQKFMTRIHANAERVSLQLNNLIGVTAVDNQQLKVTTDTMDLNVAIEEAINAVRDDIDEREQFLDVDIESNLPLINADPDAMYHVLTNLLQNAHRCSPDDAHIVLRAHTVQEGQDAYVAVAITDSGGGVAPEDSKKVFNRFYRSDDPEVPGLGDPDMALPIVKVLIEAHGGRIWMETTRGIGNTFTTLLPVHNDIK